MDDEPRRVDYAALNIAQVASESDDFTAERYRQFARRLPAGRQRVLDVGCGLGRGGSALREVRPQASLVGFDCVPLRLARVPADIYEETVLGDALSLPFPDATFDAVVAGEFIEHLAAADVDVVILGFRRVLRVGGILLLTTPNPQGLRWRLRGASPLEDPSHLSVHPPPELAARLERLGFVDVRARGSGRVTRYLGERLPVLALYQSYLIEGRRGR